MHYIERALFVVGNPNAGKSRQIRSMFRDIRLGTKGKVPRGNKVKEIIRLSNNRQLYIRLTSPTEMDEDIEKFLKKIASKTKTGRWCIVSALQLYQGRKMKYDADGQIRHFVKMFSPERVRVCFLCPDHRRPLAEPSCKPSDKIINALRKIKQVEYIFIDGRDGTKNGLLLSDFLDFS